MARKYAVVLVTLLVAACATPPSESPPASSPPGKTPPRGAAERAKAGVPVTVLAVVDGRTVQFENGARLRISLLAPPAACWAADARAFAEAALLNKSVRVTSVTPGEVNLELEDGTDYALLAVRRGVLRAQGASGAFADAEVSAALEKRGLWGSPCNGVNASTG
jgi:endonuclease YncB( thermonuclease family)